MDVFQCPVCALKFRYSSELDQHLAMEHPEFKVEEDDAEDELLRQKKRKKRDLQP